MGDTAQPGVRKPGQHELPRPVPARSRAENLLLSVSFLLLLAVPNLDLFFHLDPTPFQSRADNRFPEWRWDRSLLSFPGKLMYFLQNSMGFRGSLVRAHGLVKHGVLAVSPTPSSVILAEPWLFLKGERTLEDYRRVDPFSPAELSAWKRVVQGRVAWLRSRGSRYLFVIAPNKETVYAAAVPDWIRRKPGVSRLEQLVATLRELEGPDFAVVDLRVELTLPAPERLYHFTDTHWNDVGAFQGYRGVALALRRFYPELTPLRRSDFELTEVVVRGGDLARMSGLQWDLQEPQLRLTPKLPNAREADGSALRFDRMDVGIDGGGRLEIETRATQGSLERGVILRDSFGELLLPYLSEHFQRATWLWTYDFPRQKLEALAPQVVIQELVERKLMVLEPGAAELQ